MRSKFGAHTKILSIYVFYQVFVVILFSFTVQILSLIPKESDGEQFEDALARVRRCVGGGTATENADSDSDLAIVADSIPVNLRCPVSSLLFFNAGNLVCIFVLTGGTN